jgi:DNA-binding CsgD family transcriptional regulator
MAQMASPPASPPESPRPRRQSSVDLRSAAAALYDDLRLSRILTRLLDETGGLLGVAAGSVSLIDAARVRYAKAAERGAVCRLGHTFPLDEGITGRVADGRRPVVLARYSEVRAGHLPAGHPAARGAVAAVPIWWRGEVLGVNVAFAALDRRFSAREVDQLEVLSQVGAAGIAAAAADDPALSVLLTGPAALGGHDPSPLVVTEVGAEHHRDAGTSAVARSLVALAERDVQVRRPVNRLRVVLLHEADRLRVLLFHEHGVLLSGTSASGSPLLEQLQHGWSALVSHHAGTLQVERVPGWGVLVLVDLPHAAAPAPPLTAREQEVLGLLARGLSDRQVGEQLVIARKTVEKHVGAILRKTGTTSRTAAVVRGLDEGWLPGAGRRATR